MGKEAKAVKERTCSECEQVYFLNALKLREHAKLCKSARAAGLILPSIVQPKIELVKLYD